MITQEQYDDLMQGFQLLHAKVDLYIQCQNSTEKEFRELERDVYNLKQRQTIHHNAQDRMDEMVRRDNETLSSFRQRYEGTAPQQGVAWLR